MTNIVNSSIGIIAMFVAVIVLALGANLACGSLASEDRARSLVENQGFTNVVLEDRDNIFVQFKGCSKDDVALFTFNAINSAGRPVTVDVCSGWPFKGATIRG